MIKHMKTRVRKKGNEREREKTKNEDKPRLETRAVESCSQYVLSA